MVKNGLSPGQIKFIAVFISIFQPWVSTLSYERQHFCKWIGCWKICSYLFKTPFLDFNNKTAIMCNERKGHLPLFIWSHVNFKSKSGWMNFGKIDSSNVTFCKTAAVEREWSRESRVLKAHYAQLFIISRAETHTHI